ncbi:MAG TPA: NAD(P)/FAD-dependent oxidoreductase, partial [Deltaproteobacteria bacterium]|nr:NAD(P)/FAD-dependent oxidoreductase [Deltaproteobacteria bacterium]HPJ94749.1 NAD(P)/FAD-dependent oxidoreductase [Deltaproteobacteria bacterium]
MAKADVYDLIVAGAGSGGCATAKVAAEQGLKVLLIDKRKKDDIGDKLTFDTIPAYTFEALGIPVPEGDELDIRMLKLKVFPPNRKCSFEANLDGYLAHRRLLGQRLLKYALDAGCTLLPETEVIDPIVEGNFITGVKCKDPKGTVVQYRSKIVVDASGIFAVVRDKLPHSVYHNEGMIPEDTVMTYREIRDLKGSSEIIPQNDYPGWYCTLENRGYFWIVPEDNGKTNIGCGLPMFTGHPDPVKVTKEFCDAHTDKIGKEIYAKGTGPTPYLPMRPCQPELVGNGFMLVGDSGYQVSTNSGFGVPGSVIAGKIAAEVAASAIRKGDVGRECLWEYNVQYKRGFGSSRPFADAIRIFVQNLSHDDLNALVETGLMGSKEFSALWSDRTFDYTIQERIEKFKSSQGHPSLFIKVSIVFLIAKRLEKLYKKFPSSIDGFNAWMLKRTLLYALLFKVLGLKRG